MKKEGLTDIKTFDYNSHKAIYNECQEEFCPNKEIEFLSEFLKRGYELIFITFNQPYYKFTKVFDKKLLNKVKFIDCTPHAIKNNSEDNVLFLDYEVSLFSLSGEISKQWNKLGKKRLLFLDCAEFLFMKYETKDLFKFIHRIVQKYQQDGVVIFCFLNGAMDKTVQTQLKHLFSEVTYL